MRCVLLAVNAVGMVLVAACSDVNRFACAKRLQSLQRVALKRRSAARCCNRSTAICITLYAVSSQSSLRDLGVHAHRRACGSTSFISVDEPLFLLGQLAAVDRARRPSRRRTSFELLRVSSISGVCVVSSSQLWPAMLISLTGSIPSHELVNVTG